MEIIIIIFTAKTYNCMKYIGAHVSSSGGVENAPINANKIGAKSFAFFTKNQRQWVAANYSQKNIDLFKLNCEKFGYNSDYIMPHASFLINLGNSNNDAREKSINAFIDEINRCEQLGVKMINFHPGSHLNAISTDDCLDLIANSINIILDKTNGVTVVIENTAGQGTNLGYKFEQIAQIINKVEDKNRVGVCIDTAHTLASGYEIRTEDSFNKTFKEFDDIVGFSYLKGMHINDSKKELATRVDRHDSIGKGVMREQLFDLIINYDKFNNMPLILETPDETIWDQEIKYLYSLQK